ncbi:MAG: T9SS type A sorting domain-containing protein [candidate division WOR-3 bacterium]
MITKILVGLSIFIALYGQWNKALVGTAPNVLNLIRVGDGRNDGVQRVYAICEDARVYEWTYTGSGWTRATVGILPGSGWCLGIDIGKGRNDGLNRVYATQIDGNVYEFFWNGTQWIRTALGNPNNTIYGVCVGPGRNDGINRIYASGDGTPTVEYTWTGSFWDKDTVQNANLQQWLPYVGPGRNDGVNRLYLPNSMGSTYTVAEYTWTGSNFSRSDLPAVGGNPLCITIGPGRNDGINRLYASSRAKVYEFTYQSGTWQTVDIIPTYGNEGRYNITLGKTKIDGKNRIYITCSGTQFLEVSWSGSSWVDTVIDAVSAATCGVAIGRGRNDDTVRVYGCNRNGEVWEFTHIHPYVGIEDENRNEYPSLSDILKVFPNPTSNGLSIKYTLNDETLSEIAIYDITGKKIKLLFKEKQSPGSYEVFWDGRDDSGKIVPNGIYILHCSIDKNFSTKKFVFVK